VRTEIVRDAGPEFYFDIDVVNQLVGLGFRRIAKVDVPIGHHFARDLPALRRKINRRIEDFLYWRNLRNYPWLSSGRPAIARFAIYTVLVLPLVWQSIRGWLNVRDRAWLYHIPVCWLTLWLYSRAVIKAAIRRSPHSREGWQH